MAHTSHYLCNASNTIINNPTITHVNGNASFGSSERHGLRLLLDNISKGAFHDAAERGDPPKCHPDTRVAIREEIVEWIKAPEAMTKLIIWMYGPAGAGKTAIGQSIAEECKKTGFLAASFFFGRTAAGRNDTTRVVATIAYQISRFLPQIESYLFTAIEQDPTIFSRTLATQMQVLVVEPLKFVLVPLPGPVFVILDGLDESGPTAESQADLLKAIGTAISELQHIPLSFLISSRPEYEIREAFAGPLLHTFMRPLSLDNNYNPDADIKLYLESTFRQIHDKCLRLGVHLSSTWPSNSDVDRLVSKASGQFIFAATVMKFVDSVRHNPKERLDIILGLLATGNETPFALLDALYRHILSSVADLPQVLETLTLLLLTHRQLTVKVIGEVLGIEVHRVLIDMHALIFVPPPTDDSSAVRIHHASLYDFLTTQSRSREYYIDRTEGNVTLSFRWLKAIGNRQISPKVSFLECIATFVSHCKASPVSSEIANALSEFRLRPILEEMFPDFAGDIMETNWSDFFHCIKRQVKPTWRNIFINVKQRSGDRVDVLARLQGEFLAFFMASISKYPKALQDSIPTILALAGPSCSGRLFPMLLYAVCQSPEEIDKNRRLDSMLLDLCNTHKCHYIFCDLFDDRSLVGDYCVNSASYLTLAKKIVSALFPKPKESDHFISLGLFSEMLNRAAIDTGLARFLLDHALQYGSDRDIEGNLAGVSLRYVRRCGLPYLKHTHLEGTDRCVICNEYGAASIVIGSHLPRSQPYSNHAFDNLKFTIRRLLTYFKTQPPLHLVAYLRSKPWKRQSHRDIETVLRARARARARRARRRHRRVHVARGGN